MKNEGQTIESQYEEIIKNINLSMEQEGFCKKRLAKKMNMSLSNFYAHLQGRRKKTIFNFASNLANVLGYRTTYFFDEKFDLPQNQEIQIGLNGHIAFSADKLSDSRREGLKQIGKICDLIDIYY